MISCTRSSGSAYSCAAEFKADQRNLSFAARLPTAPTSATATEAPAAVRGPETPKLAEFVAQHPVRVEYLDRAFALGALDDAVQKTRDRYAPAPASPFSIRSAGSDDEVLDPVDDEADGSAAVDHDDPRGFVERRVGEAKQPRKPITGSTDAMQIGKPEKTSRRERHVSEVRHAA